MSAAELLSDVLRSRDIGDACRALLVAMVTAEVDPGCRRGCRALDNNGMVRLCREELSAALGLDGVAGLKAVSNRIAEAKRAGLLKQESGGRNGAVAGYRLVRQYRRPGPDSLSDLLAATLAACAEDALVGTTGVVPREGPEALVGTTGVAPYARAHYLQNGASKDPTTAESREERDDDVTGKGGTNGDEWIAPPSRRPSSRRADGKAA